MRIQGEVTNGILAKSVTSIWSYDSDDPWVVEVNFLGHGAIWNFSLDLLREAFTSPSEGLQGSGDVLIEVGEGYSFIHLTDGIKSATVKFLTDEIREFLNQVDDQGSEEIVARQLEEFLGAL